MKSELLRELPSVDAVLRMPALEALAHDHGTAPITAAARAVLARLREAVASGLLDQPGLHLALDGLDGEVEQHLRRALAHSLRPVINATGVILHTNLGRAPLAEAALAHIHETAGRFSNLEFDLESGVRGKRDVHVDRLFRSLLNDCSTAHVATAASAVPPEPALSERSEPKGRSAAEPSNSVSTIVVNNNAAAVLLALNTLAEGGEVIVSRGELVEIGGSFRIPDIMAKSGATLREVGTTNRTRIADYESAITDRTRLLLRVHRSNFEITGFTEQASTAELVTLERRHRGTIKEVTRVQSAVAQKFIQRAMELVCSRTSDRVDDAPRGLSVVGGCVACDHGELLNSVHAEADAEDTGGSPAGVVIHAHSVQPVTGLLGPRAVDRHHRPKPTVPARVAQRGSILGPNDGNSRLQGCQSRPVASVEWEFLHDFTTKYRARLRSGQVDRSGLRSNRYFLLGLS